MVQPVGLCDTMILIYRTVFWQFIENAGELWHIWFDRWFLCSNFASQNWENEFSRFPVPINWIFTWRIDFTRIFSIDDRHFILIHAMNFMAFNKMENRKKIYISFWFGVIRIEILVKLLEDSSVYHFNHRLQLDSRYRTYRDGNISESIQ